MQQNQVQPEELEDIRIPGFRLAARAWGPRSGLPVLALHGWLDNAASFDTLAPHLPELRIVALDLPGHGRSEQRAAGQAYHFVDWLPVVFDVANALGYTKFALMGHSMGAGIAALAAGTLPERVEQLVLLEGLGPSVTEDSELPLKVTEHLRQRARLQQRPRRTYPNLKAAARALLVALPELEPASALCLAGRGTTPVADGVTFCADPRLRLVSMQRLNEAQVAAFLQRIQARSLVVYADRGLLRDRERMQRRCGQVQDLSIVEVHGGHHVHLDHPSRVAPHIRRLFELDGG